MRFFAKIAALPSEKARTELQRIVADITMLLPRYIAKSSLGFMTAALVYFTFRTVSPAIAREKERAITTFEREAYEAAKSDVYAAA